MNSSAQNVKPSTRKTSELTAEEALQILGDVILKYQRLGGEVVFVPEFTFDGRECVGVVFPDVQIINGTMVAR